MFSFNILLCFLRNDKVAAIIVHKAMVGIRVLL